MSENLPGQVITFYSYKGGTGRTMILANIAWILASNRKRVLVIDWDLEAPGLHHYFRPFLVDKDLKSSEGMIDFLIDYSLEVMTPPAKDARQDEDWHLAHTNYLRYTVSLQWQFAKGGTLDFIPAGRQDSTYSTRVNTFDWANFYDRLGGGRFLDTVRNQMKAEYDYILIDSRTGVSDTSGICTVQMPDKLVVCFTLNNQSIEGAAAVAASVAAQRNPDGIKIFPSPMRVDPFEQDKLALRKALARERFGRFLWHIPSVEQPKYWGEVEIPYRPYYAYEEILATFGDSDEAVSVLTILKSTQRLMSYLTDGEVTELVPPSPGLRGEVLAEFADRSVAKETESIVDLIKDAERSYLSLREEERVVARNILIRLIALNEKLADSRRVVFREELIPAGEQAQAYDSVLTSLTNKRLIVTDGQTYQIAQEALIVEWPRLREWLDDDRRILFTLQGLSTAAKDWVMHDRDGSYLYHGARLEEAEKLARDYGYQLNIAEREFLEASLALLERERAEALYERAKSRSLLLISVIALITSLLGIIMSYYLLTGPATVTAMVGTGIYAGPGTQYDLLDQLPADTTSDAIGKSPDGEWWVIEKPDAPEGKGWVAASDVTTARAGSLPTVMPPPTPTPTATPAATPTTLPSPRARPTLLP